MTLMPFLTLLPLKSLEIQAGWGGVAALSRRQQGFKSPWGRQLDNNAVRKSDGIFYAGMNG